MKYVLLIGMLLVVLAACTYHDVYITHFSRRSYDADVGCTTGTVVLSERQLVPEIEVYESPAQLVQEEPVAQPDTRIRRMRVYVRGYTPWDSIDSGSPWRDGRTAYRNKNTREMPHCWGVAVHPGVFPFGTKIRVPGYTPSKHYPEDHWWEADDTGGVIRQAYRGGWVRGHYFAPGTVLIELRYIHGRSARKWNRWVEIEYILPQDQ